MRQPAQEPGIYLYLREVMLYMNVYAVLAVLVFIGMDVVSGMVKAFSTTGFDSSVMRQGFYHKLGEVLAVGLLAAADFYLPIVGVNVDVSFSAIGCAYFVLMEIGSIIENIGTINPELVGPLTKIFAKLKGD
jgi:phage-related holin